MSRYDPSPGPPGPAGPDPGHLLARAGVRWTIIGVVVSTLLAVVGLVVQTRQDHGTGDRGGTVAGGAVTTPAPGPVTGPASTPAATPPPSSGVPATPVVDTSPGEPSPDGPSDDPGDGLTVAERGLRDSLNSGQWQRESCEHETAPGATAALTCTVTTDSVTAGAVTSKADVALYPSRSKLQEVYRGYAGRLPEGNCDQTMNVRGIWHENDSTTPAGDMACYASTATSYVIFCTYYDRPALFQVTGVNPAALTAWWHTLDPVFTG